MSERKVGRLMSRFNGFDNAGLFVLAEFYFDIIGSSLYLTHPRCAAARSLKGRMFLLRERIMKRFRQASSSAFLFRRFRFFSRVVVVLFFPNLQHSGMIFQYVRFSDCRLVEIQEDLHYSVNQSEQRNLPKEFQRSGLQTLLIISWHTT